MSCEEFGDGTGLLVPFIAYAVQGFGFFFLNNEHAKNVLFTALRNSGSFRKFEQN